ncbi:pre-mRNA-processing factor 39 isoform X2 [Phymastichus coffea]|uniref:pre-mRNA-processing factor 39 isoform X2 n=1 Tax=Phymastichus coffea TaxID=108790 RepID=UPI00273AA4F3|nr:pre-mRNA-processing factor 39 isoform X2 [Phymastichus coffea]
MSSLSGDENSELVENEPVRRTRSGRTVKAVAATPKKTPAKKATRATRAAKSIQEVEEENSALMEDDNETSENGMQQEAIEDQDSCAIQLQLSATLENEEDTNQPQGDEPMNECESEQENQTNECHETLPDDAPLQEQENIPEFDPETDTNNAPPVNNDNDQSHEKKSVDAMDDDADDQCILIEDDTDNHFGLDDLEEPKPKERKGSKIKSNTKGINSDEVIEISDQENDLPTKKTEPDTEAVSEDELPAEAAAKEPETEAVSDEELPAAQPADLGETESVSEDELPLESEKKRKGSKNTSKSDKKTKSDGTNKRKRTAEGEYDPSSPTSENNDETPAKKATISTDLSEKSDTKPASPKKKSLPELEKYWKAVNDDPSDFTGWTYLLQYVDQENDAEAAREAYSKFLERYPYCYGYWRKYADYEKKKGDPERVQTVFDQGLKAISLSVDLWLHYINHCKVLYEKNEEKMREQYERAIDACGLEFRSDRLWESYIKWETENKRHAKVMAIYDRLLNTPTLGYMSHFESFQEFITNNSPNRILNVDDFLALRGEVKALLKAEDTTTGDDDAPPGEDLPPNETPPTDEETRAIREKIISSRRKMHKMNVNAVAARWTFEEGIKRPYFHVKPLERCQLKNWKEYLDYEIEQKDQNRIVVLFERCLIACALYDEFWLRYIRYLESLKGDNIERIRDVYTRACKVHHPKKPNLHLQWATFEESQNDFDSAASILENIDSVIPNMLQVAYRRINIERRRGDLEKTCSLYEHYVNSSKNRTIANNIVVKYARFLCKIKNETDRAVKVLLKATEKDKDNPRLYLQLIDLGLQRTPINVQEVVSYMDLFIDREHADAEQRVLFAQRKVEFLEDFSTDIRQVLKAHEQFQKCIKQAKERKKTKNDDKSDVTPPKKTKTDTSNAPPAPVGSQSYQYSSSAASYQSQQQFQSGQYGSQSSYQQGYQQYPPPSDPNYANYQNWQYGQSGPQAYAPYNQWGSYNYY